MRELDRIREELKAEEATLPSGPVKESDPQFESDLAYALAQLEPSDALIDILMEMPIEAAHEVSSSAVTSVLEGSIKDQPVIDFAQLRHGKGLTSQGAATILDVSAMALDRLEAHADIGWLNLNPVHVRKYLDQLGINPGMFVRAVAAQLPQGPSYAYGYRPRMVAQEPLAIDEAGNDRERLVAWAHELYRA
jgi:hypothetical protein